MQKTKVFKSGNSMAVRLPKDIAIDDKELYINKIGSYIVLMPENDPWEVFENGARGFSEDFLSDGRNQPEVQKREGM